MTKKIKQEKKEINPIRVEIGRKGAQSLWGDSPRPRLARISVESDLGPVVAALPLADRVRITSQALRIGFSEMQKKCKTGEKQRDLRRYFTILNQATATIKT